MPRPPESVVVKWRELAASGKSYAEIARGYTRYSADQVRHYCMGTSGRDLPGPLQPSGRWEGRNVWLQGDRSPHAALTKRQAIAILDDWDDERDRWKTPGSVWAGKLGVSSSTVHMLRRGDTWQHLEHPNQGRVPGAKKKGRGRRRGAARS